MKGDRDIPSFSDIPAESASYYDRNAASYSASNRNPADFIDEFLGYLQKGNAVLDLGSGPGINAAYMHARNLRVIAIDLSEKMVDYAKSRYPEIDFRLGDMTKMPFPANSFDGIFASYSLIHLPKDAIPAVFAKLHDILMPGGVMYLSVQSGNSVQGFYSHPTIPEDKVFLNIFSKEEMLHLLIKYGFQLVAQHERPPQGKVFAFTKLFIIAKKS